MNPSLSVILPVHNAEQHLIDRVTRLLEILPDLADQFDLLIVDDGSTDQTAELARELATIYPQIRLLRHDFRRGHSFAVQAGLNQSAGEIALIQNDDAPVRPGEILRQWSERVSQRSTEASTHVIDTIQSACLAGRLKRWTSALAQERRRRHGCTIGMQVADGESTMDLSMNENPGGDSGVKRTRTDTSPSRLRDPKLVFKSAFDQSSAIRNPIPEASSSDVS